MKFGGFQNDGYVDVVVGVFCYFWFEIMISDANLYALIKYAKFLNLTIHKGLVCVFLDL